MNVQGLVRFLNKLETSGVISVDSNSKIQKFLDYDHRFFGRLFLVLSAIMGALFCSAGIFAIIAHNWDDLPKHLRGFLSLIPSAVGLYFYYLALFKHKNSVIWIEAASIFLCLMIGASIWLVSQTYHMDGDFYKFVKVWLFLTLPLFYIAKASGIAIIYLGMNACFAIPLLSWGFLGIPTDYDYNDQYYWAWIFLVLMLPHFVMHLNFTSKKQGPRIIFLGWVIALFLLCGIPVLFKAGYLFWLLTILVGFQFFGHRFFSENLSIEAKPFQFLSYGVLFFFLLAFSNRSNLSEMFEFEKLTEMQEYTTEEVVFYYFGLVALLGMAATSWLFSDKKTSLMRFMNFLPAVVLFGMAIFYLEIWTSVSLDWISWTVVNLFVLAFGIAAMIYGNREKYMLPMFYGLFLVCSQMQARYMDTDISFWLKGIVFLGVGGLFFFIHYVYTEEVDTGE